MSKGLRSFACVLSLLGLSAAGVPQPTKEEFLTKIVVKSLARFELLAVNQQRIRAREAVTVLIEVAE